jgi:hypothetical protein
MQPGDFPRGKFAPNFVRAAARGPGGQSGQSRLPGAADRPGTDTARDLLSDSWYECLGGGRSGRRAGAPGSASRAFHARWSASPVPLLADGPRRSAPRSRLACAALVGAQLGGQLAAHFLPVPTGEHLLQPLVAGQLFLVAEATLGASRTTRRRGARLRGESSDTCSLRLGRRPGLTGRRCSRGRARRRWLRNTRAEGLVGRVGRPAGGARSSSAPPPAPHARNPSLPVPSSVRVPAILERPDHAQSLEKLAGQRPPFLTETSFVATFLVWFQLKLVGFPRCDRRQLRVSRDTSRRQVRHGVSINEYPGVLRHGLY